MYWKHAATDFCEFCKIYAGSRQDPCLILKEDTRFFAFHDIQKATAVEHVLVCTVDHVDNALEVSADSDLIAMRDFGVAVLDTLAAEKHL